MKKIALFGGSFDPIHIGHLITATNVVEKLNLDKLIFIPSNITPLKNNIIQTKNVDRYNMIKLSIANNKYFEISDYEITKNCVSYTYYTAKHFKNIYKKSELYFIVGTDRIKDLYKWHKIEKLKNLITFIFVARNNENIEEIINNNNFYKTLNYKIIKQNIIEISSTKIREKIKNKKNVDYILTPQCLNYIKELKLYEF